MPYCAIYGWWNSVVACRRFAHVRLGSQVGMIGLIHERLLTSVYMDNALVENYVISMVELHSERSNFT
jgi:hypothetical protein